MDDLVERARRWIHDNKMCLPPGGGNDPEYQWDAKYASLAALLAEVELAERARCLAYASALRSGELDDARIVVHGIRSGLPLEDTDDE